ncbi:endospore germination permease [Lysinibacillus sp. 38-6]|uniref:GerAB/ArcD/ProY family transporter n=1 Tax=Lysinibacillus sp. 38-6 TaxID=3385991 RepID=UPI003908A9AA
MEKQIISSRQFTIITLLYSIGTAILIVPASITKELHQDAWIGATIGVLLSLLLVKLFVTLGNQTPNKSFIEANKKILGKYFGLLTSLGFLTLTFFSASELLYFIGSFMQTEIMPETPTLSFAVLFTIIIVFASYLGIEVFARSAELLFPIFMFIFIVFIICISPQINIENIQPIFETRTKPLIMSTLTFMSIFSFPLVVLLMVFPSSVNVQKSAQKGFYIGTLIGGVVLIIIIALSTLVIGPTNTSVETFPSYALAQRISIGNFFERIEIIMAIMWIISIYIRTFIYFYATVIGLGHILNIKDPKPFILPLGLCMIALAQIAHPNIVHANSYNQKTWPLYSAVFTVMLASLLLIIAKIRKIKKAQNQQNTSNKPQVTNMPEESNVQTKPEEANEQSQSEEPKEQPKPEESKEQPKPEEAQDLTKPAEPKEQPKPEEAQDLTKPAELKEQPKPDEPKEQPKPEEAQDLTKPAELKEQPKPDEPKEQPTPEEAQDLTKPAELKEQPKPDEPKEQPTPEEAQDLTKPAELKEQPKPDEPKEQPKPEEAQDQSKPKEPKNPKTNDLQ